jgi:hypothetical protein
MIYIKIIITKIWNIFVLIVKCEKFRKFLALKILTSIESIEILIESKHLSIIKIIILKYFFRKSFRVQYRAICA